MPDQTPLDAMNARFLPREEFSDFRSQLMREIEKQGEKSGRDIEAASRAIRELTTTMHDEIRRIQGSIQNRRFEWAPVAILTTLAIFVLGAFGSLAAYNITTNQTEMARMVEKHSDLLLQTATTRYTSDDAAADNALRDRDRQDLRAGFAKHDRDVSALNARQDTLIERAVADIARVSDAHIEHVLDGHPEAVMARIDKLEPLIHESRKMIVEIERELARRTSAIETVDRLKHLEARK